MKSRDTTNLELWRSPQVGGRYERNTEAAEIELLSYERKDEWKM